MRNNNNNKNKATYIFEGFNKVLCLSSQLFEAYSFILAIKIDIKKRVKTFI